MNSWTHSQWIIAAAIVTMTLSRCQGTLTSYPDDTDACQNHTVLDEAHRHFNAPLGEEVHCDDGMQAGWYRLTHNGQDAELPRVCLKHNVCGTRLPLRLEMEGQALPDTHVTVWASVCTSYEVLGMWDCCVLRQSVGVRNCSGYYIYYLWPVDRCPVSYCVQESSNNPGNPYTLKQGERVDMVTEASHVMTSPGNDVTTADTPVEMEVTATSQSVTLDTSPASAQATTAIVTSETSSHASTGDDKAMDAEDETTPATNAPQEAISETGNTEVMDFSTIETTVGLVDVTTAPTANGADTTTTSGVTESPSQVQEEAVASIPTVGDAINSANNTTDVISTAAGQDTPLANETMPGITSPNIETTTVLPEHTTASHQPISVTNMHSDGSGSTFHGGLSCGEMQGCPDNSGCSTRCDGRIECNDGSDEFNCDVEGTTSLPTRRTNNVSDTPSGSHIPSEADTSTNTEPVQTDMSNSSTHDVLHTNETTTPAVHSTTMPSGATIEPTMESTDDLTETNAPTLNTNMATVNSTEPDVPTGGEMTMHQTTEPLMGLSTSSENVDHSPSSSATTTTIQAGTYMPMSQSSSPSTMAPSMPGASSSIPDTTLYRHSSSLPSTAQVTNTAANMTTPQEAIPHERIYISFTTTLAPPSLGATSSPGTTLPSPSSQPQPRIIEQASLSSGALSTASTRTQASSSATSLSESSTPTFSSQSTSSQSIAEIPSSTTTQSPSTPTSASPINSPISTSSSTTGRLSTSDNVVSTTPTDDATFQPSSRAKASTRAPSTSSVLSAMSSTLAAVSSQQSTHLPTVISTITPDVESTPDLDTTTIVTGETRPTANPVTDSNLISDLFKDNIGLFVFLIVSGVILLGICLFGIFGYAYQQRLRTWTPRMAHQDAYADMEKSALSSSFIDTSGISNPIPDVDILSSEHAETSLSRASTLVCGPSPSDGRSANKMSTFKYAEHEFKEPTFVRTELYHPDYCVPNGASNHGYITDADEIDGMVPVDEIDETGARALFPWIEQAEDTKL